MIQVMIVDDEPLAQEKLKEFISQDKDFNVVTCASNGKEALEKLRIVKADVVFLDIEMPGMDGLEVAAILSQRPHPPLVVFATAYHEYAIRAFERHAVDYILKPFTLARLQKTLDRLKNRQRLKGVSKDTLEKLESELIEKGMLRRLIGRTLKSKERVVIEPSNVDYFHKHYTRVIAHLGRDEYIVSIPLKRLLNQLTAPHLFVQTHRGYIVNLNRVEKVVPVRRNFEIHFKESPSKVPLSRRFAGQVKQHIASW